MQLGDRTKRVVWTTFTSEQIDIDVRSAAGRAYLDAAGIDHLVEGIHEHSHGSSRLATGAAASNVDL